MRFVRHVLLNMLVVMVCAVLIQAAGAPVDKGIVWGAAQVQHVVQRVPLPGWIEAGPVKEIAKPVHVVVDHTLDWVARLSK